MSKKELLNKNLGAGIVTIPADPEQIPSQSSQGSIGWISTDGQIELCKGRLLIGALETATTSVMGHIFGKTWTGGSVQFRKQSTKIQYYNTATSLWVDIITGLTATAEYTFSRYQSVAGTFVYATGVDGIYKIHTANPGSYTSLYDATKNYKGKSMIANSRMFLWGTPTDKTGLYLSYIDLQDSSVYTTVTAEVLADVATGTLAFKAGDAKRTCFAVVITDTSSGEIFTDNYDGTLTGSISGTGTINYTTGAFTITGQSGAGTATYNWEMTNNHGITDFTYSGTRTAGQGNVFRQDEGGDKIETVEIYEGKYYSLKSTSVYELDISSTAPYADLSASNKIFKRDIGVPFFRSSVVTGKGIMFMDTSNLDKPRLTILQRNIAGDNLEPFILANQFDFSPYVFDACDMNTFGEYVVFSARTEDSTINDTLFMYNLRRDTVDIISYGAKTIVSDSGLLYIGDTNTGNVYEILSGFDDDGNSIENEWISNDERYGSEYLKKVKRMRFKGLITQDQALEVYISYDNDAYELVGTILGSGVYVDFSQSYPIGSQGIGTSITGGDATTVDGNFYLAELKISSPKFRKRSIKLAATGTGYVSVNSIDDFDIRVFQQRIPSKYRIKQNVSLSGLLTDQ